MLMIESTTQIRKLIEGYNVKRGRSESEKCMTISLSPGMSKCNLMLILGLKLEQYILF